MTENELLLEITYEIIMTELSENMRTKKLVVFSESKIEVAKLLIQLSTSNKKAEFDDDAESSIATTTREDDEDDDDDDEEDIGYGSKLRYRDIEDIYNATEPISENKAKRVKY
ncbi:unnamed protein product [Lupinus luteus]|uniref:Uncharacterized protein n=1 Tax=Lupinus luteus TaxID=3873 RepID=A0AAV1XS71_LUPLU